MAEIFITLPSSRRRILCDEASAVTGLSAQAIEKDYWICWTLRHLFSIHGLEGSLIFKGGTSLSKAWQLIERFSEDIDIVVGRGFLEFRGDNDPERDPGKKQRGKRIDALKSAGSDYGLNRLARELTARMAAELRETEDLSLASDPDDKDK